LGHAWVQAEWLEADVTRTTGALLIAVSLLAPPVLEGQATAGAAARESTPDLIGKLNADQKREFGEAGKASSERRYADALALHQRLLKDIPGDPILRKFCAEDEMLSGDTTDAVATLKSIVDADPDDWQGTALLVRAYAQGGNKAGRDAGMAHMVELHERGMTPPNLRQYPVESVKVGENTLTINSSLVPWGPYKVNAMGKMIDGRGALLLSVTLESSDFDQPGYAKDHPADAAKGMRRFSFDSYRETGLDSAGTRTQTQAAYGFVDGHPAYEAIRDEFIKIADGRAKPMATRSGLKVP
jgi:hypothetical protein